MTLSIRGVRLVHLHKQRHRRRVHRERRHQQPRDPTPMLTARPGFVPRERKVQDDDHLNHQEEPRSQSRRRRVRLHSLIRRPQKEERVQRDERQHLQHPIPSMQRLIAKIGTIFRPDQRRAHREEERRRRARRSIHRLRLKPRRARASVRPDPCARIPRSIVRIVSRASLCVARVRAVPVVSPRRISIQIRSPRASPRLASPPHAQLNRSSAVSEP